MKTKLCVLVLLTAVVFGMIPIDAQAAIPAEERAVLIDLYNSTGGAGWTNSAGWLGAAGTECSWYGITCDATQSHVTKIEPNINHMVGTLPSSIGNLPFLESLAMIVNRGLTGTLPDTLGNLTNLTTLTMSMNGFTGSIPSSLGNLTHLKSLYLGDNQLTGLIPPTLGNLSQLIHLYLETNQLTGDIPSELGNLSNLEYLSLHLNQLTGAIPSEFGNLTKLKLLTLNQNKLRGEIPAGLINLTLLLNNNSNFMFNALYTPDTGLRDFLNTKQAGGNWESTQSAFMDLIDAVLVLRVLAGMEGPGVQLVTDVNLDGQTDLAEVVYILQKEGGLR